MTRKEDMKFQKRLPLWERQDSGVSGRILHGYFYSQDCERVKYSKTKSNSRFNLELLLSESYFITVN